MPRTTKAKPKANPKPSKSAPVAQPDMPPAPVITAAATEPDPPPVPQAAKAYAEIEPLFLSVPTEGLASINVDIPRAVTVALGAAPHLLELRDSFEGLPDFDMMHVNKLTSFALAAWYAHLLAMSAMTESELSRLIEEARPLRESLLRSAELLAHHGLFDAERVKAIRAGTGNLDTANDLVALSALFSEGWDNVKNKCPVEWEHVEEAAKLGPRIIMALGARNTPAGPSSMEDDDPALRRARAYTLFVRAYDQCRRGLTFLRWSQGDADLIAPSLMTSRNARKTPAKTATPSPMPGAEPAEAVEPSPSPAVEPAPAAVPATPSPIQ